MFTERQANAILDMRLVKLIGLEIEILQKDYEETVRKIAFYQDLLENHESMAGQIIRELKAMKKEYAVPRRTVIEDAGEIVVEAPGFVEEEVVFCMDRFGYVKTIDPAVYEKNREACEADYKTLIRVMNTDRICIFTDTGKMHSVKITDIPQKKLREKGIPVDNISHFSNQNERILYAASMSETGMSELFFATEKGLVKRTSGSEFVTGIRTIQSTKLAEGDRLTAVLRSDTCEQAVLKSRDGYFLRFPLSETAVQKKAALGVRGMELSEDDMLDGVWLLSNAEDCVIPYMGSSLSLKKLRMAKRGGKGTRKKKA